MLGDVDGFVGFVLNDVFGSDADLFLDGCCFHHSFEGTIDDAIDICVGEVSVNHLFDHYFELGFADTCDFDLGRWLVRGLFMGKFDFLSEIGSEDDSCGIDFGS